MRPSQESNPITCRAVRKNRREISEVRGVEWHSDGSYIAGRDIRGRVPLTEDSLLVQVLQVICVGFLEPSR